ncbi:pentapeptide repeat-containing protein [Emticicia sp.]|uniref:pentapeptide repeat-containing protein n=1 Tax=Emticicia sp. TaxID=1930953 RepID=UPI003BAA598F
MWGEHPVRRWRAMIKPIIEEEEFNGINFTQESLRKGEYEGCTFTNCDFSNLHLSNFDFVECEFEDCNLSNVKISNTAFKQVKFSNCKLLGVNFGECNPFLFSVSFDDCFLHLAGFYKLKMKGTKFKNCNLKEADFTETDLSGAVFDNCEFTSAVFERTILEKADLRTSQNFSIDPELNRIKKAKFSLSNVRGLLDKYNIEIEN